MGKLIGSSIVAPAGGAGKVKVKYRGKLAKTQGVSGVEHAVAEGRKWLELADRRLREKPLRWETRAALEHWMVMDHNDPSDEALAWMQTVIAKTRTGIEANMTVKVHQIRKKDEVAFVRWRRRPFATEGRLYWEDEPYGPIHLDSDIFADPDRATFIFLHEAFHRYGVLDDHDERGYSLVKGKKDILWYREPGLTKAEALNNAESYARVVHYIWHN
jgi:hypothetical protein